MQPPFCSHGNRSLAVIICMLLFKVEGNTPQRPCLQPLWMKVFRPWIVKEKVCFCEKIIQWLLKFSGEVLNTDGKMYGWYELNGIRSCPHTFTMKIRIFFAFYLRVQERKKEKGKWKLSSLCHYIISFSKNWENIITML